MMDPNRDHPLEEQATDRPEQETEPAISPGQPPVAAGIGVGLYTGRTEEVAEDNDQESHVSPADNDGETVPQEEVGS